MCLSLKYTTPITIDTCTLIPNNLSGMFCACVTAQVLVMLQFPNRARNKAGVLRREEESNRRHLRCTRLQGFCFGVILALALAFFGRWLYSDSA
jgi:hypothetical protein